MHSEGFCEAVIFGGQPGIISVALGLSYCLLGSQNIPSQALWLPINSQARTNDLACAPSSNPITGLECTSLISVHLPMLLSRDYFLNSNLPPAVLVVADFIK